MAHIIELACEVSRIHARYARIHQTMFGFSMRRAVLKITGQGGIVYVESGQALANFQAELETVQSDLTSLDVSELTRHAGDEVFTSLLHYTTALLTTIQTLMRISHQLSKDETEYRSVAGQEQSQFQADKVIYDHAIQELGHWGAHLNELFKQL